MAEVAVKAAAGRVPVMVHVGANATAAAIRLARHAEKIGVDAVSVLPPTGVPYPPDVIWEHFRAIGASCGLPLYLYHLPQIHGDLITVDRFVQALDSIPTLAGAKFSSYRIDDLIELRSRVGDRLNILSGCSEQLLSTTACGVHGSICSWHNVIPKLGHHIVDSINAGNVEDARAHQELLVRFGRAGISYVLGAVKAILTARVTDCGVPRRPVAALTGDEARRYFDKLDALGMEPWLV